MSDFMVPWFDCLKGYGLEKLKIGTSADGSKVWAVDNDKHLTADERRMLIDVARQMGASLTDPDGVYRRSVNFEAQVQQQSADTRWGDGGINETYIGIERDYNRRALAEQTAAIEARRRRELDALG